MLKRIGLYYRTIKHLKPIQIRYRLWYMLRGKFRKLTGQTFPFSILKEGHALKLALDIQVQTSSFQPPITFTFLNQSHTFGDQIDWNFDQYSKLWAYNLNYFDYLHQRDISKEQGLQLIRKFIEQIETNREGIEPYPISLRGINWIKFLSMHKINDAKIDACLYAQYRILFDNIEYHLMGNHLLENGCSLLFGAYYFQEEQLLKKARKILLEQIDEQILSDGGHFERSTMYHGILLERLMDCYNLIINNNSVWKDDSLGRLLLEKISKMLGWAEQLSVGSNQLTVNSEQKASNRELPLLNDAAMGIGPLLKDLEAYADRLGIQATKVKLSDSGYRKYTTERFELICDVGNIGPDYIPGHAHSDTFSFILFSDSKPVIIDPGISTYENNSRRLLERSTAFHNTVQFDHKEQTEVWGAFRVGRRAKVHDVKEIKKGDQIQLSAWHDGYQTWNIKHKRSWMVKDGENQITIEDLLLGETSKKGCLNLHFHPDWTGLISLESDCVVLKNIVIKFSDYISIEKGIYDCPHGYNRYEKASKVTVAFKEKLTTDIQKIS